LTDLFGSPSNKQAVLYTGCDKNVSPFIVAISLSTANLADAVTGNPARSCRVFDLYQFWHTCNLLQADA